MKNILIILIFILSGCSFKTPANQAQYETVNAFSSYTKNFLSANDSIAKNDINRAISHAKKSADFNALARIYLGECALNISVGIDDNCKKYLTIKELLVDDGTLKSYYSFISSKTVKNDKLPKIYKTFNTHLNLKEYNYAYEDILKIDNAVSQLLLASLIRKHLNKIQISKIIEIASFHGYKKSILFWLNELRNITKDESLKKRITKKIEIIR